MLRTRMPVICFDEPVDMVVQFKMFLITKDHKLIPFGLLQGDRKEPDKFVYQEAVDDAFLKACGFDRAEDAIENNYILLKPITSHKCPIGRPFDIVGADGKRFVEYSLSCSIRDNGAPITDRAT